MHDKNGKPLKVGDKVLVEAVISTATPSEDYCNVTLSIGADKPHGPNNITGTLVLNSRQVELVEEPE